MASISTNQCNGHKTIQFVASDGKRRSIRLGKVSTEQAREIKEHVEALSAAAISGEPWKRRLAIWVRELDRGLYDKLAAAGLVAVRSRNAKLSPFLAHYVKRRADVKAATVTVYGHTRRNLVDYFGADKRLADIEVDDAKKWRTWLADNQELSKNTVNRRCAIAKQFLKDAVDGGLIDVSPFDSLKGVQV